MGGTGCPSPLAPFLQKGSQFQQSVDHQAEPEIDQGSEVKLERVMFSGWRQIGVEGEIQAIAEQNGKQVFEPLHGYGSHLHHRA